MGRQPATVLPAEKQAKKRTNRVNLRGIAVAIAVLTLATGTAAIAAGSMTHHHMMHTM